MINFIYKFKNFMLNRYGSDELSKFLFKIYILLVLINLFVRVNVIFYIELLIMIIILLRYFSKKINKREKENILFLKLKKLMLKPFKNISRNLKDKDNVYKKCHKCKTILKLPLPHKIGFKKVKCPECNYRNKFLILKKEKIKIIRNKK